jgi:hypothetical protein
MTMESSKDQTWKIFLINRTLPSFPGEKKTAGIHGI